jgi:hypothetical protein
LASPWSSCTSTGCAVLPSTISAAPVARRFFTHCAVPNIATMKRSAFSGVIRTGTS